MESGTEEKNEADIAEELTKGEETSESLNELTKMIMIGDAERTRILTSRLITKVPSETIVMAMDKAIDYLATVWYDSYGWGGITAKKMDVVISEKDFEKAWEAYEGGYYQLIKAIPAKKGKEIATATFGSPHKTILKVDLHLKLAGFNTTLVGYGIKKEDIIELQKQYEAIVLSIPKHTRKIPSLTELIGIKKQLKKPVFLEGEALLLLEAWYSKKINFKPQFILDVPKAMRYSTVEEMSKELLKCRYCNNINKLIHDLYHVLQVNEGEKLG